jgi:hypothetical protein
VLYRVIPKERSIFGDVIASAIVSKKRSYERVCNSEWFVCLFVCLFVCFCGRPALDVPTLATRCPRAYRSFPHSSGGSWNLWAENKDR